MSFMLQNGDIKCCEYRGQATLGGLTLVADSLLYYNSMKF